MDIIKQGKRVLMKADYEIEQQNEHECKVCGCVYGFYEDEYNIVMTASTNYFFSKACVRYKKVTLNKELHTICPNCQEDYIWNIIYPRVSYYKEKRGTNEEWEEVSPVTGRNIYMDYLAWKRERKERYGI